jgi:hypothetical protein
MTLQGHVVKTLLRGKVIYDVNKGILATAGFGRLLRRQEPGQGRLRNRRGTLEPRPK